MDVLGGAHVNRNQRQSCILDLFGHIKSFPQSSALTLSPQSHHKIKSRLSVPLFRTFTKQTNSQTKPSGRDINDVCSSFSSPCDHWVRPCTSESLLLDTPPTPVRFVFPHYLFVLQLERVCCLTVLSVHIRCCHTASPTVWRQNHWFRQL